MGTWAIRSERPGDEPEIHALHRSCFETPAEADLVEDLRQHARPLVSLVAVEGTSIVGHVLFSPVEVPGSSCCRIMGLAPLAVASGHRRRGMGSALVRSGLEACRGLGPAGVVVLGEPGYYARFGFVPSVRHGLSCPYDVPQEAFMVRELQTGALAGCRGKIRYHPAFERVEEGGA